MASFPSCSRWLRIAALCAFALSPASGAELERLEIVTRSGVHVFDVELAATGEQRMVGLMHRKELAPDRGMLFDFDGEQHVSMWMRNTYISLDMLFIAADGRIVRIAERTEPLSERTIPSGVPVRAVLEIVGGTSQRLGIAPGDRVAHRIFRGR